MLSNCQQASPPRPPGPPGYPQLPRRQLPQLEIVLRRTQPVSLGSAPEATLSEGLLLHQSERSPPLPPSRPGLLEHTWFEGGQMAKRVSAGRRVPASSSSWSLSWRPSIPKRCPRSCLHGSRLLCASDAAPQTHGRDAWLGGGLRLPLAQAQDGVAQVRRSGGRCQAGCDAQSGRTQLRRACRRAPTPSRGSSTPGGGLCLGVIMSDVRRHCW